MTEHVCTACFRPADQHPEACDCGARHWPALCCPGCDCRSFEEAHGGEDGPRCHDCADHDGTCPTDGRPCDPRSTR